MQIVLGLTALILSLLVIEAIVVRRRVSRIPLRIHVNGTRGKSSVTEYLAAVLRASGRTTLAKVTGVEPTLLLPDGSREVIRRRGRVRVHEQFHTIRRAARLGCEAVVLECMSIAPELQRVETRFLRPGVSVLTNILDDHREELGDSEAERVEAFCAALPSHALLVTGERVHGGSVARIASARSTQTIIPPELDTSALPPLPPNILPQNLALALSVSETIGISKDLALEAILREVSRKPDSPLMTISENRNIRFINGFAVNDVPSAQAFLRHWHERLGGWNHLVFVLNTRSDRPLRSLQFARWCAWLRELSLVVVVGTHVAATQRDMIRSGMERSRIIAWSRQQIMQAHESLLNTVQNESVVIGIGNIAGDGLLILEQLQRSSDNER